MRKRLLCILMAGLFVFPTSVKASSTQSIMTIQAKASQISVIVPTEFPVVFESDGTNVIPDFYIENDSTVPMKLSRVVFDEMPADIREWNLISKKAFKSNITDSRDVCIKVGKEGKEKYLELSNISDGKRGIATFNEDFKVPVKSKENVSFVIKRSVFTKDISVGKAFRLNLDFNFSI